MKETINERFNKFARPEIGAVITLNKCVRGMHYGRQKVIDAFKKLVPKDEYASDERSEVLNSILQINTEEKSQKTLTK